MWADFPSPTFPEATDGRFAPIMHDRPAVPPHCRSTLEGSLAGWSHPFGWGEEIAPRLVSSLPPVVGAPRHAEENIDEALLAMRPMQRISDGPSIVSGANHASRSRSGQ